MSDLGYFIRFNQQFGDGGPPQRVQVGPYGDRETADRFLTAILQETRPTFNWSFDRKLCSARAGSAGVPRSTADSGSRWSGRDVFGRDSVTDVEHPPVVEAFLTR